MPLDSATRQLARALESEVEVVRGRENQRRTREERLRWDPVSRIVSWETKNGEVVGRWYGEVVARYIPHDRILRWTWVGRETSSHAEIIAREGDDRGAPQLAMSVVGELDEDDALRLAHLGIVVARGQGMHVQRGHAEIELIGLFDTPRPRESTPSPGQYSVPPPIVARSNPPGRVTNPPAAKIREPARAIFVPVATAVLARLAKVLPAYRQALFVLTVDPIHATLTVIDGAGLLRSIDLPGPLVDAAARMVDADRADGNGRWRKLTARISPKADGGASLAVDVL